MDHLNQNIKKLFQQVVDRVKFNRAKRISIFRWSVLFIFLYIVGMFLPTGFDWIYYFSKGVVHPIWTPWSVVILKFITWPLVVAITLSAIIYRTYQANHSPLPVALAVLSLPTLWVLFMGNLDGLVLLGLMLGPIGIPLTLMKPQVAGFAILANKKSIIIAIVWVLFSLLVWGLWPLNFLMALTPEWAAEFPQDISLFPWGLLIAVPLLWLSRGDEDLLMAAGSFATPHLFPYHFILLMPALGRMKWPWMLITWSVSWTPLLANWLGEKAWHFGNLMSVCFWIGIYMNKKQLAPRYSEK